jgi:hypothetical protein
MLSDGSLQVIERSILGGGLDFALVCAPPLHGIIIAMESQNSIGCRKTSVSRVASELAAFGTWRR